MQCLKFAITYTITSIKFKIFKYPWSLCNFIKQKILFWPFIDFLIVIVIVIAISLGSNCNYNCNCKEKWAITYLCIFGKITTVNVIRFRPANVTDCVTDCVSERLWLFLALIRPQTAEKAEIFGELQLTE